MINLPPIPKEMEHLKKDHRGFPVPYMVPIIDGKPNFRFTDQKKQEYCIDKNLCGICGNKLNKDFVYFIAGPKGLANEVSSDPAMHRACAEFSLMACPHLHIQKTERVVDPKGKINESFLIPEKPPFIFLVRAYKFKGIREGGARLCKFKAHSAETYQYINGLLEKSPMTLKEAMVFINQI